MKGEAEPWWACVVDQVLQEAPGLHCVSLASGRGLENIAGVARSPSGRCESSNTLFVTEWSPTSSKTKKLERILPNEEGGKLRS